MGKKNIGSSLDDFLKEEGTLDETLALAIEEVVVWQVTDAMPPFPHVSAPPS